MKQKRTYQEEASQLLKAIDLAIEAYQQRPPKDWTDQIIVQVVDQMRGIKVSIKGADKKHQNLRSLQYDIEAVFTYFQEAANDTTSHFWKRIDEEKLHYQRENKLAKILQRGRIKSRVEYEYVIDMMVVAEQLGMTTKEDTKKLNELIAQYEQKRK